MHEESSQVEHGSCGQARGPWARAVPTVPRKAAAGLGVALGISMETPHLKMLQSKEIQTGTGMIPLCTLYLDVESSSQGTEANFAIHLIGKVLAGVADQWSKVFLNLIFPPFIVRKVFQISMKISRGDSSQSIQRSSSELLMKFDRSKLERP